MLMPSHHQPSWQGNRAIALEEEKNSLGYFPASSRTKQRQFALRQGMA